MRDVLAEEDSVLLMGRLKPAVGPVSPDAL